MRFKVSKTVDGLLYYVSMNNDDNLDASLAKKIGVSLKKYIKILKRFKAFEDFRGQYYFRTKNDCLEAINYLNETYGIMLTLIEGE